MPTLDFDFIKNLFFRKKEAIADEREVVASDQFTPIQPTPIGDVVETPETFEQAVDYVAARIDHDTVSHPMFHWTGGMNVRNTLRLWQPDSALHRHMLERFGLCHADDTGALITSAAHAKVNGTVYDINADVERFKDHWARAGVDPATGQLIAS